MALIQGVFCVATIAERPGRLADTFRDQRHYRPLAWGVRDRSIDPP